jgi:hypothetical protein
VGWREGELGGGIDPGRDAMVEILRPQKTRAQDDKSLVAVSWVEAESKPTRVKRRVRHTELGGSE